MTTKRRRPTRKQLQKYASDIEVIKVGDRLVSARPSGDTISAVSSDYREITWQLRQIGTMASQRRHDGQTYTVEEVRRDFAGRRVLDFADDRDLVGAINGQNPSVLAQGMIARVLNLRPETVVRYDKLARQKKPSRKPKN